MGGTYEQIRVTIKEGWSLYDIADELKKLNIIKDSSELFALTGVPAENNLEDVKYQKYYSWQTIAARKNA